LNVFRLRDEVVDGYADYVRSFLTIADLHIKGYVEARLAEGHLWPEALVQPNPASETGATSDELVAQGVLHLETSRVFRRLKETVPEGDPLQLRMHQEEAVRIARTGASYVLTTRTGSGKSLTYFVPIMDDALSNPAPGRIKAIVVFPMNPRWRSWRNSSRLDTRSGERRSRSSATRCRSPRKNGSGSPPTHRTSCSPTTPCSS
jgi:hypothetical protein